MNHAYSYLAKTKVAQQLGYFPAFLLPAVNSSLIFRSLVQQTLSNYVNNPLPNLFKEKLFVGLSRYVGATYFTICHSCTLKSLGVSATKILALGNIGIPRSESEISSDMSLLLNQWQKNKNWDDSLVEISLLRCSYYVFLYPQQADSCIKILKQVLGVVYYNHLSIFLGYIKLCHHWLACNPQISHRQDRRSQLHLGTLLLSDSRLASFVQSNIQAEELEQSKSSIKTVIPNLEYSPQLSLDSQVKLTNFDDEQQKKATNSAIIKSKTLTDCLAKIQFPVMVHSQNQDILYLNHNWVKSTGYSTADIPTVQKWRQKAQVRQYNTPQISSGTSVVEKNPPVQLPNGSNQNQNMLSEIAESLSNLAEEISQIDLESNISQTVISQFRLTTSKGEQRFWESYTAPFRIDDQEELTISIAKDITEIVNIKANLSAIELENSLELLLEETDSGVWSWDIRDNRIDFCQRSRSILGLDNFDGTYESFLQSINPEVRESIALSLSQAVEHRCEVNLKFAIARQNYAISLIRFRGKPRYNFAREVINMSGIVMKIRPPKPKPLETESDQKNSQSYGTQSYQELIKIINLLPCYVFVSHIENKTIDLINLKLSQSLDLSKSETACGRKISEYFSVEYACQVVWQQQQILTYGEEIHLQEEVQLSDGIHYFDTKITPLRDDRGKIYATLHTSNDIPDLAATKEALYQRTLQLEAANRELESFSYSVSHDLQAPLRIINGFSQVLWENYQPQLDDRGKHYLQRIQANSEKMNDLIDALLQLSRVTRSQMKSVEVDLSSIANNIIDEFQQEEPHRAVEFIAEENLTIKGDPQLLNIVLNNLLNNAWKYTSKRSQAKIEFKATMGANNKPTFYVRDNGAGFDSKYVGKLFNAFQRLHSQAEFPGTGIGLATVQRIIYRHGGKVWAEGECDRGATIYFSLN